LVALDASQNELGNGAVSLLLGARGAPMLRRLKMAQCNLGVTGARALGTLGGLEQLQHLELGSNGLGDDGITAFVAGAPRMGQLHTLTVENTARARPAAAALTASPWSGIWRVLSIPHNRLPDAGADARGRARPGPPLLSTTLQANKWSPAGAAPCLAAPAMAL